MIWLLLILLTPADGQAQAILGTITVCDDTLDLTALFDRTLSPKNQYTLTYLGDREIQAESQMILRFDSEVSLKLKEPRTAQISKSVEDYQFIVTFYDRTSFLRIQVFGPPSGYSIPYVQSVILNGKQLCEKPKTGYLFYAIEKPPQATELNRKTVDAPKIEATTETRYLFYATEKPIQATELSRTTIDAPKIEATTAETRPSLDESCGRRKLLHTALIVHGESTQPGDWPWHAAILRLEGFSLMFRCGGTLLSKTLVLTAAHCATIGGHPVVQYSLTIFLGKHNIVGGDIASQERGVFQVIVHSEFDGKTLNNDIALLRLNSEAVFDDYVQPACLWHPSLPNDGVDGKVVGWGLNHLDQLSHTLQLTTVPIVSELKCLKSNPIFFTKKLNVNKFCGGYANGTSVCNGDSGGGLVIFVPDRARVTGKVTGAWYVRGIVSLASQRKENDNICDPYMYTLFTDVSKYRGWVLTHWS